MPTSRASADPAALPSQPFGFYTRNGKRRDAELHAEILFGGDHAAARAVSADVARELGLTPEQIEALLGGAPIADAREYVRHPKGSGREGGRFAPSESGGGSDEDISPPPDKFEPHDPPTPGEKEILERGNEIKRPGEKLEWARDERDAFRKDLPIYQEQLSPNHTYEFMATPKGIATFSLNDVHGEDKPTVELHWLVAHDRGAGRAALDLMTKAADKHGVTVQGYAVPLEAVAGKTMSVPKLEKFYGEFGFKPVGRRDRDGYKKLVREPKSVKDSAFDAREYVREPAGTSIGGRFAGGSGAESESEELERRFGPVGSQARTLEESRRAGRGNIELGGVSVEQTSYEYFRANKNGRPVGTLNISPNGPYASSVVVEPGDRRQGVAKALYAAAEKALGRPLIPSPLGLSPEATGMWKGRLAKLDPAAKQAALGESLKLGRTAGIPKSALERMRSLGYVGDEQERVPAGSSKGGQFGKGSGSSQPRMSKEKFEELLAGSRAEAAERKEIVAKIEAAGKPVRMVSMRRPDQSALVGPDVSEPGKFRITRFDPQGPIGHTVHNSLGQAAEEALREGYRLKTRDAATIADQMRAARAAKRRRAERLQPSLFDYNTAHEPAGKESGGQFTTTKGGGGKGGKGKSAKGAGAGTGKRKKKTPEEKKTAEERKAAKKAEKEKRLTPQEKQKREREPFGRAKEEPFGRVDPETGKVKKGTGGKEKGGAGKGAGGKEAKEAKGGGGKEKEAEEKEPKGKKPKEKEEKGKGGPSFESHWSKPKEGQQHTSTTGGGAGGGASGSTTTGGSGKQYTSTTGPAKASTSKEEQTPSAKGKVEMSAQEAAKYKSLNPAERTEFLRKIKERGKRKAGVRDAIAQIDALLRGYSFDDREYVRHPKGSGREGGRFAPAEGGGGTSAEGGKELAGIEKNTADLLQPSNETVDQIIDKVPGGREFVDNAKAKLEDSADSRDPVSEGGFKDENGNWTPERQAEHDQIVRDTFTPEAIAAATPPEGQQPTLDILGGRGGSGKSFFTGPDGTVDESKAIVLNNDNVKEALSNYKGWNAADVHEEGSEVGRTMERMAKDMGLNVVIDGTMKSEGGAHERIDEFKAAGYKVNGHYMYTSPEKSAERALKRAVDGEKRFNEGKAKVGGRFVDPAYSHGSRTNEKTFDAVKHKLDNWQVYDNNVDGRKPQFHSRKGG